mgnify:CR=1 FL=1
MTLTEFRLLCGVCRDVASEETIVYRLRFVTIGTAPLRKSVCLTCCQPELTRLRSMGHEIIGIIDAGDF